MSYEPGLLIAAWLIAGQAIYSLRRLSFHMLWEKVIGPDITGGQEARYKPSEDPLVKHFSPSEFRNRGGTNVHRYPGADQTALNIGYWALILATWPVWATFGYASTFLGLSWLWREGDPDVPTGPDGFWKWMRDYLWYWQLPRSERTREADCRRRVKRRKLLLASRRRQLTRLTLETAYETAQPFVDDQILREELLPHADLENDGDNELLPERSLPPQEGLISNH